MTTPARQAKIPANRQADQRSRLIRLIHVARRDLNLDEEGYRTVLLERGGSSSAAAMNIAQLQRVLDYLKKTGFKVKSKKASGSAADRPRVLASDQQSKKARAMWLTLHAIGQVRDPSETALLAYARRQCKVDRLEWVSDFVPLIESLKAWLLRSLPNVVNPYLAHDFNLEEWSGHMPESWKKQWAAARMQLWVAQTEGYSQILDQWLALYDLIILASLQRRSA